MTRRWAFFPGTAWPNSKATSFDGLTQTARGEAPNDIKNLLSWSVSFWGKFTEYPASGQYGLLFALTSFGTHLSDAGNFYVHDANNWGLLWREDDQFAIYVDHLDPGAGRRPADRLGLWTHFLWTHDDSSKTLTLYCQGAAIYSNTRSGGLGWDLDRMFHTIVYPLTTINLGAWPNSGGMVWFKGRIDELAICSGVRAAADFAAAGKARDLTGLGGLLHWWRCGDGYVAGSAQLADSIGSAHLSLINGGDAQIVEDAP